jgi:hypothetical protein
MIGSYVMTHLCCGLVSPFIIHNPLAHDLRMSFNLEHWLTPNLTDVTNEKIVVFALVVYYCRARQDYAFLACGEWRYAHSLSHYILRLIKTRRRMNKTFWIRTFISAFLMQDFLFCFTHIILLFKHSSSSSNTIRRTASLIFQHDGC